MAHNYIVTAQKPTAVNACVTGNEISLKYSVISAQNCVALFSLLAYFIKLKNLAI